MTDRFDFAFAVCVAGNFLGWQIVSYIARKERAYLAALIERYQSSGLWPEDIESDP